MDRPGLAGKHQLPPFLFAFLSSWDVDWAGNRLISGKAKVFFFLNIASFSFLYLKLKHVVLTNINNV